MSKIKTLPIPEVPQELSLINYSDEEIDLAIALGIIDHKTEANALGYSVDPPTKEELLTWINLKYTWLIHEGGTGQRLMFHRNNMMPLHEAFSKASDIVFDHTTGRNHWVYKFVFKEPPRLEDTGLHKEKEIGYYSGSTRLPHWLATHHTNLGS